MTLPRDSEEIGLSCCALEDDSDPYADSRPPDDECGECALEAQHDGPCAWLCDHCSGSGRCPVCSGTGGYDDVQRCSECDAGYCPYCTDGLVSDE